MKHVFKHKNGKYLNQQLIGGDVWSDLVSDVDSATIFNEPITSELLEGELRTNFELLPEDFETIDISIILKQENKNK
jgi:hypothetical protein